MKSIVCSVLLLVFFVGPAHAAGQSAAQRQGQVLRLHKIAIYDRQGWGQPVVAYTMLVPDGWRVQGGVQWHRRWHCLTTDIIVNRLRVTSPNGQYAFEWFPDYAAKWYDDPTMLRLHQRQIAARQQVCPLARPFRAVDFLTHIFLPAFRRGAQVVNVQQNPQAAQALYREIMHNLGAEIQQSGMQVRTDAARALLRYQGSEELVMATTAVSALRTMSATAAAYGRLGYTTSYTSSATKVFGFRAPPGEMQSQETLFSAMLASIHINPVWQDAIQRFYLSMQSTILKGAIDRANIWSKAMNDIGDIQMRTWQNQQATQDRVAHRWSEAIRGTGDFIDPSTNTKVELPWGYDNEWSSGNGEYLLSTIPGFNPNTDLHSNRTWTRMKAAR